MKWWTVGCAAAVAGGALGVLYPVAVTLALVAAFLVALGFAAVRSDRRVQVVEPPWCPELILLPTALGIGALNGRASLLAVTLLAGWAVTRSDRYQASGQLLLMLAAAGIVWAIAGPQWPRIITAAGVVAIVAKQTDIRAATVSVIDGVGIFLAVNVAAYYGLGMRSPVQASRLAASLDSTTGLFGERVIYPFTTSLAIPPVLAATYVAAAAALVVSSERHRALRFLLIGNAAIVLLGANSRLSLVAAVLVAGAVLARPRALERVAIVAVLVAITLPFWYPIVRGTITPIFGTVAGVVPALQRPQEDLGGLNNRDIVWAETFNRYRDLSTEEQALGFGPNGQIASGASQRYGSIFRGGFSDPTTAGSHNSALQQLLDGGAIGLGLFLVALGWLLVRWRQLAATDYLGSVGLAALVTMGATSATEAVLAPGTNSVVWWLLLVFAGLARSGHGFLSTRARMHDVRGEPVERRAPRPPEVPVESHTHT